LGCEHPLGLPEGSVRAIIALIVILGAVLGGLIGYFQGLVGLPENLWQLALIVAAFYFGMRSGSNGKIERVPKEEICEIIKEVVDDDCITEE